MSAIEDRLERLGLSLPRVFAPPPGIRFGFERVQVVGEIVYISGHGPMDGDRPLMRGKVGAELTLAEAQAAARLTCLSILASLRSELGELDRVVGWVKALGFVNAAPGFNRMPMVIDGFSDLIVELWGDAGRHARSAIGVAELPVDIPVEVEAIARLV